MTGPVVLDANLLLLLIVGLADSAYVDAHKRLNGRYSADDFDVLSTFVGHSSEIILVPHVVAEVANLSRQIGGPARRDIQLALQGLVVLSEEASVTSRAGVERDEFLELGLTDAVLLALIGSETERIPPVLLTADAALYNRARSLGHDALNEDDLFGDPSGASSRTRA